MSNNSNKGVNIFSTTDIHGFLYANQKKEGGLTTLFDLKKQYPDCILIDNGDYFIGSDLATYYSHAYEHSPLVDLANQIGFDVMVAGNHDFDFGLNYLKKQVEKLDSAYLCCNAFDQSGELIFDPYTIVERQGKRFGVIGALTSAMPQLSDLKLLDEVHFVDAIGAIKKCIQELEGRVDYLILAYHGGREADMQTGKPTQYDTGEDQAYRIAKNFSQLDGLIFGHQHFLDAGVKDNLAYTQSGSHGNFIGHIQIDAKDEKTAQLIDSTKLKANKQILLEDQVALEVWLDEKANLEQFFTWLKENTSAYLDIEIQGSTRRDFKHSFSFPYSLSQYILTDQELLQLARQTALDIEDLVFSVNEIKPDQKYYRIITNRQELYPDHRKSLNYITAVFDKAFAKFIK
mgnify:CR=1 FL=1